VMISTLSIIDMGMVLRSIDPFGFDDINRLPSMRINARFGPRPRRVAVCLAAGENPWILARRRPRSCPERRRIAGNFADRSIQRGLACGLQRRTWSMVTMGLSD